MSTEPISTAPNVGASIKHKQGKTLNYEYVLKNFHKMSENKRVRIALSVITLGRLPKLKIEKRERNSPEVYAWRRFIFERDNYTCQECGAKGVTLNAHHKCSWADYPHLRHNINNGVTLCKPCHCKTTNFGRRNNAI